MAYQKKPKYIKEGSTMHVVLDDICSGERTDVEFFDITERKDALYPAMKHGFVARKKGEHVLTKSGRKLLDNAR